MLQVWRTGRDSVGAVGAPRMLRVLGERFGRGPCIRRTMGAAAMKPEKANVRRRSARNGRITRTKSNSCPRGTKGNARITSKRDDRRRPSARKHPLHFGEQAHGTARRVGIDCEFRSPGVAEHARHGAVSRGLSAFKLLGKTSRSVRVAVPSRPAAENSGMRSLA